MKLITCILCAILVFSECAEKASEKMINYPDQPYVIVLGIAQDAGYPQADCEKDCCARVWHDPSLRQWVSCLGIVDPDTKQCWIIDATPDFKDQLHLLRNHRDSKLDLSGIALTHAHIGHYTGLVHLGREVMGAGGVPVYAMPKMYSFLSANGPWSQLVTLENIQLRPLKADSMVSLNQDIQLRPILVPHRDEYSETVGYEVIGNDHSLLFIPDIDKWSEWEEDLRTKIGQHDYALLDGSFYTNGEIPGRDMSEIPHPFVVETMQLLKNMEQSEKEKVHFIHLNHTNPLLDPSGTETREVRNSGFRISRQKQVFIL